MAQLIFQEGWGLCWGLAICATQGGAFLVCIWVVMLPVRGSTREVEREELPSRLGAWCALMPRCP